MSRNLDERHGRVTEDPAITAPIGAGFTFQAKPFPPAIPSGEGEIREWDHFGSALLAVTFGTLEEARVDGSAVLIAPGLALAARHVFDPVLDDLMAGKIGCLAVSITSDGMLLWRLHQLSRGDTDVVILRLNLASDFPKGDLHTAPLTTRTPAFGEPIMVAGIRAPGVAKSGEPFGMAVRIGVGEVGEVHATGRDQVMLPHPTIEVKCLTVGGMSGGPAFDKNGHLIGVLSSSFEAERGPSFVSLWWPVVPNAIESMWPPGMAPVPTNLLTLGKAGIVAMDRPEVLSIVPAPPGQQRAAYVPWT